jgi:hypothetical protein
MKTKDVLGALSVPGFQPTTISLPTEEALASCSKLFELSPEDITEITRRPGGCAADGQSIFVTAVPPVAEPVTNFNVEVGAIQPMWLSADEYLRWRTASVSSSAGRTHQRYQSQR